MTEVMPVLFYIHLAETEDARRFELPSGLSVQKFRASARRAQRICKRGVG